MTFQEWLQTEEGRLVSFEKMPRMLEIVWSASAARTQAEITELKERAARLHDDVMNGGAAYVAKCYTVTELQRINNELLAERDEYKRRMDEYADIIIEKTNRIIALEDERDKTQREIERLRRFMQTIINLGDKERHAAFDGERWRQMRHCANRALNSKDDIYEP